MQPPPPSCARPESVRRRVPVEHYRALIAFGESQRQRLLVDHMKLLTDHTMLQKQHEECEHGVSNQSEALFAYIQLQQKEHLSLQRAMAMYPFLHRMHILRLRKAWCRFTRPSSQRQKQAPRNSNPYSFSQIT